VVRPNLSVGFIPRASQQRQRPRRFVGEAAGAVELGASRLLSEQCP